MAGTSGGDRPTAARDGPPGHDAPRTPAHGEPSAPSRPRHEGPGGVAAEEHEHGEAAASAARPGGGHAPPPVAGQAAPHVPPPPGAPVLHETWDARPGGRLRGALVLLPAVLWAFAVPAFIVAAALVSPGWVRSRQRRFMHAWGHTLCALFGIRIEVAGGERLHEPGARLLYFNHQSLLDLVVLTSVWPENATVLYKQEFHRIPFFGRAMDGLGLIPIDRGDRQAAIASLSAAAAHVRERGSKVFIAPEGTRSRTDGLLPFKRGPFHLALQTRAPVLPLVFRGVRALLPPGRLVPRPGRLRVDVLPPLDTRAWSGDDLDARIDAVRALYLSFVPGATKLPPPRVRRAARDPRPR